MASNKISTKSIARIAAVQAMYQYKSQDLSQDMNLVMQQTAQFYKDERTTNIDKKIKVRMSISHFELLVKSVIINLPQIDQTISKHLIAEWDITSLPILLLALLRVAICELQFFPDIPYKVVINEFTDIASDMLTNNEVGFVNSVLDMIASQKSQEDRN